MRRDGSGQASVPSVVCFFCRIWSDRHLDPFDGAFGEAATVFQDEDALQIFDPDHSEAEDRFILLGMSSILRILVVCHCYRANDDVIRIISARKATRNESSTYKRRK